VAVPVGSPGERGSNGGAPESLTIPHISPLRGSQPQGSLTISIGAPMERRPAGIAPVRRVADGGPIGDRSPVAVVAPAAPLGQAATEPLPDDLPEPDSLASLAEDGSEEPPLPEEAGAAVTRAAGTSTVPLEAGPGQVLHIRFGAAPDDRIVAVFTELRTLIRERPGITPVVLHIPAGSGRTREMRLGSGIAYDADLLAETERRFGGLLRLELA
jgi:hypothetical protein